VHLLEAIGLKEMLDDERFKDAASRREHTQLLRDSIQKALFKESARHWEPLINEAGVPAAEVLTIPRVMESEQAQNRQFLSELSQLECGLDRAISLPTSAFKFQCDGPKITKAPPRVGEHVDELLEELGYTSENISVLKSRGIV
jgi:formyl-CoA transferase